MGGKGKILLQVAMSYLIRYGEAMEVEELIPITSAHTINFRPTELHRMSDPHRCLCLVMWSFSP